MKEEFHSEQKEQSKIKKSIVVEFFNAWAKIMLANRKRYPQYGEKLGYIDFYSGPGIYEDGNISTPIEIMKIILSEEEYCQRFVTIFNDSDIESITALEKNISNLENYEALKYEPVFNNDELNPDFYSNFEDMNIIPSLIFLDPCGFKGISANLINELVKCFGCDIFLFFNYNSIQRFLTVPNVSKHFKALFTDKRYVELLETLKDEPQNKESLIIDTFITALKENGVKYVMSFRFIMEGKKRTSHYLMFLTKNEKALTIIKDIMAKYSSNKIDGVAELEFIPSNTGFTQLSLFDENRLEHLKDELCEKYSSHTISVQNIITDLLESIFTTKNIKDALLELEKEGRLNVIAERKRKNCMPDKSILKFR